MSIDLITLTSLSGLPLFTRRVTLDSDIDPSIGVESFKDISLNTIATLYGLNLFSRLNECELQLAKSTEGKTRLKWKSFKDSITLVIVAHKVDHLTDCDLNTLTELIYHSIVLMCGFKDISESDCEKLKRSLKSAYSLIDYVLNLFVSSDESRLSVITRTVPYAFTSRSSYIASIVNSISRITTTSNVFCAIFMHQKLLSANKNWWTQLSLTVDSFLVSCLINSFKDLPYTKEIVIYLPNTDPNVPTRLIVSQLASGLVLAIVCDKCPSIEFIETEFIAQLKDSKIQDDKLSRYINLKSTKSLPQSTISDIFNKQQAILSQISAFVFINFAHNIHFVYNELIVQQYLDELICFFDLEQNDAKSNIESFSVDDDICMYKVTRQENTVCALFENSFMPSIKQMNSLANTLIDTVLKAKHFWP